MVKAQKVKMPIAKGAGGIDGETSKTVTKIGKDFEKHVEQLCIWAGFPLTQVQFKPEGLTNLYGAPLAIDVQIVNGEERFPNGLSIEVTDGRKAMGSANHKIPHKMLTLIMCCESPSVLILEGKCYTRGNNSAIKWAKNMVGKQWLTGYDCDKLLGVFTFAEFVEWINHA